MKHLIVHIKDSDIEKQLGLPHCVWRPHRANHWMYERDLAKSTDKLIMDTTASRYLNLYISNDWDMSEESAMSYVGNKILIVSGSHSNINGKRPIQFGGTILKAVLSRSKRWSRSSSPRWEFWFAGNDKSILNKSINIKTTQKNCFSYYEQPEDKFIPNQLEIEYSWEELILRSLMYETKDFVSSKYRKIYESIETGSSEEINLILSKHKDKIMSNLRNQGYRI